MFEETHFNLLFSKNEKKLKYLIKNFMMVRIEVDWMHLKLIECIFILGNWEVTRGWIHFNVGYLEFLIRYWMIKSSHRPCTLMEVDNRLTLVHFLHKSLEIMLMYDTALFLCPQQWRGKIFQLSHRFLFNYSLWQSILAFLSSF